MNHNEWIEEYIIRENKKRVGLLLSGGTDSALVLYLICKIFIDKKYDARIVPIHGFDTKRVNAYSVESARSVIRIIKQLIPDAPLEELFVFAYYKNKGEDKNKYHIPVIHFLLKDKQIDIITTGTTLEPSKRLLDQNNMSSLGRTINNKVSYSPISTYTKDDVAELYYELGLMIDLFPVTVSCIKDKNEPCRKCWWCKEKYYAFKMYDGGLLCSNT